MGSKFLVKALSHVEPLRLGLGVLAGFFVASVAFLALPNPSMLSFSPVNLWLSEDSTTYSVVIEEKINSLEARENHVIQEMKPVCDFSGQKSDVCEIKGDIRVHGNSSEITFITSPPRNESWSIRPHPRKTDINLLSHVTEISIKSSMSNEEALVCTHSYNITAIIFSTGGYMGNMFHDFSDVLIPLFLTAREFKGEVKFLVSEIKLHWIRKYRLFFKQLSHYDILDFNKDEGVHCFKHVIVGLRSHKEMSIDPSKAPNGYSMVDFTSFMRKSFALQRESAIKLRPSITKKPRLLIIARKRTRSFTNVDEIVRMAESLGYEAVVGEAKPGSDLSIFAKIVNSCDVMMGVHGAGLTNLVFLPVNATVIQIVPLGRLDMISWIDFGGPAIDMNLNYLQYDISVEESSLIQEYPRDHMVFKDPVSVHKHQWSALRKIYLDNQNVKIDVQKFRFVLLQALHYLRR